ncbi:MAG TPA: SGNH family hydrolase [Xanthobacteraceae bacterium]
MAGKARATVSGLAWLAEIAAVGLWLAMPTPALAQIGFPFFDNRTRYQMPPTFDAPRPPPDFSHAPPPRKAEKKEGADLNTVLVIGDSMADWLAYGLELAFVDTPEIAVVRRHRTHSSLIFQAGRSEQRSRSVDWPAAARDILAKEPASFVVMMIGLADREAIRERAAPTAQSAPKTAAKPAPGGRQDSQEAKPADAARAEPPAESPAAEAARSPAIHEFKSERWVELYSKRIDEMIDALKSKGVPVFWVGLAPLRGMRSTSDMAYLNDLFRARAEKAGITYVDVWDGFVDENGRFASYGPDFEGQTRRLRTSDGVYFTTAGARKLAHFLEREIQRALTHSGPIAIPLPEEPEQQAPTAARPDTPMPRPLAGPVVPLNASLENARAEELLGASSPRQEITDALAGRVLVRGEPVAAPAGRADDFAWPRRAPAPVGMDPVAATTKLPMTPMIAERSAQPALAAAPAGARPGGATRTARAGMNPRPPTRIGPVQPPFEYRRPSFGPFFFFFGR